MPEIIIKVAIADEDPFSRLGLQQHLLQNQIHITGAVATARQLLVLAKETQPDVAIISANGGTLRLSETCKEVQFEEPDLSLVAFCSTIAPYPVLRLLDAGVRGIVLKRNPEQILIDALGSVYNGDDFYCQATWPLIQSLIAKRLFKPQDRSIKKLLSARESLILALICKGKTSKEIGNILCVGRRTVETHRGHLLEKTESNKMAELMRWAFENGF